MNEEIIIPLIVFSSIFGIVYTFLMTRNKERMALIEKDQSAELFNKENKPLVANWGLKLGIMCIGISLGILIAYFLERNKVVADDVAYPSMIFMFGGVGLVVSHYIATKK